MRKAVAKKVDTKADAKIAFNTAVLKEVVKGYEKDLPLSLGKDRVTEIVLTDENKDLLEFLQDNIPLTAAQSVMLSKWLYGDKPTNLSEVSASSVNEFFRKIAHLTTSPDPLIEVKIANKWYPVKASVSKFKTFMGDHIIDFHFYAKLGDLQFQKRFYIGSWDFTDNDDRPWKRTFDEVLAKKNIRAASPESIERAKKLNAQIIAFSNETNKQYDAWGVGLVNGWWGFEEVNVGWKDSPTPVIVEPDLENEDAHDDRHQGNEWHLPFVRVFSLKHKGYIYVDVESMKEHVYHRDGRNKIVLPKKMFTALDSIFNAQRENIFGDLFHGRHGGIVVMANGPSGVGKTLTAEVFAEFQERPLYSIEMSEIGTSVTSVEENLQKIFARAKKWNAVLLFDEADIFLSEREASDLERSAIVGIFLRLLDYYEGTFFLTTNRGEGIDKAFKSRVTLYLNYPELSADTRKKIWQTMLQAANANVTVDTVTWDDIAAKPLNGRQIRNQVRLLKLMYPDGNMATSNIVESMEFTAI